MKKVIVFGASGNVGAYVTKYAKEYFDSEQYEIIASGRRETSVFERMGIKYCAVDITKEEDFDR